MPDVILVVEDDPSILKGLGMNLQIDGYQVVAAKDGEEGLERFKKCRPDLVILDIMLPKINGFTIIKTIRAMDADVPILILSAKEQEADKVLGLSLGADDYVTKPFGLAEILARIRSLLRRSRRASKKTPSLRFGQVEIDPVARRITVASQPLAMTTREFDLLYFFVTHPDVTFSREQVMQEIWGIGHYGTLRTVDNFVARLRAKIEDNPEEPRYLQTVRGVGYRFDPKGR